MIYTVGEMAKSLGIPSSTLRYYDKEGLLPFVEAFIKWYPCIPRKRL